MLNSYQVVTYAIGPTYPMLNKALPIMVARYIGTNNSDRLKAKRISKQCTWNQSSIAR